MHHVPHLSGYIEEMAHNFDDATHEEFGWEMIGWTLGMKVTQKIADNPILARSLADTRLGEAETFARYMQAGCTFPADLPGNLVDRIHAHILWQCEQQYGPAFWEDYFAEVHKILGPLADAVKAGDGDAIRNARYRITIECFDRLPGVDFKKLLVDSGISLNVDVKSLHPTQPGWNRKLQESGAPSATQPATAQAIPEIDVQSLPPLHKAAYLGEGAESLLSASADVNAKSIHQWTPLHLAALGGHQEMCTRLLNLGADPAARDDAGRTPGDLAYARGHNGCAALLQAHELEGSAAARPPASADFEQQVLAIVKDADLLKPGMTRRDVFVAFTRQGGLSTRRQGTYVHRSCPYVKIDG